MSRNFVEIDETDTPYYQYMHQNDHRNLNSSSQKSEFRPRTEHSILKDPISQLLYTDEFLKPPGSIANVSSKSKNSIFDMDHKISKPITQMNDEELAKFCNGYPQPYISRSPINTPSESINSMIVPLSLPPRPSTPIYKPPSEPETAFLAMNTSTASLPALVTETAVTYSPTPVYLSFVPLQKNLLGYGQYSKVYLGHYSKQDSDIEYPCAVKKIERTKEAQSMAMTESYMLSNLSHPSIIGLIHTKDENGMDSVELHHHIRKVFNGEPPDPNVRILLILEYCCNRSLWTWMSQHQSKVGKKLWLKWARQIADGLDMIHSVGIIHHDIKPHNIMVYK